MKANTGHYLKGMNVRPQAKGKFWQNVTKTVVRIKGIDIKVSQTHVQLYDHAMIDAGFKGTYTFSEIGGVFIERGDKIKSGYQYNYIVMNRPQLKGLTQERTDTEYGTTSMREFIIVCGFAYAMMRAAEYLLQ